MEVSQNHGYLFAGATIRIVVFWGLDWGPLVQGNCHIRPNIEDFKTACNVTKRALLTFPAEFARE